MWAGINFQRRSQFYYHFLALNLFVNHYLEFKVTFAKDMKHEYEKIMVVY